MSETRQERDIRQIREEIKRKNAEVGLIDPTRGYDSQRQWNELHERIGDLQDMLLGVEEGVDSWRWDNERKCLVRA